MPVTRAMNCGSEIAISVCLNRFLVYLKLEVQACESKLSWNQAQRVVIRPLCLLCRGVLAREGDTKEEALKNVREAIELYLEPVEDDQVFTQGAETVDLRYDQNPEPSVRAGCQSNAAGRLASG